MGLLDTKYAIVNSTKTAFVYIDLGLPKESPLLKKSGLGDTHQDAIDIIQRMRDGCTRSIQKLTEYINTLEEKFPGDKLRMDFLRASVRESHLFRINQMEKLRDNEYFVVEIRFSELP